MYTCALSIHRQQNQKLTTYLYFIVTRTTKWIQILIHLHSMQFFWSPTPTIQNILKWLCLSLSLDGNLWVILCLSMLCVLNYCSELLFTVVPNAFDLKLLFFFSSAEGIWITQGFKVSSDITSLCNAAALCHPDTGAPGEFTSSREGWEIKLFSKGRRSPIAAASLRKSEAWSLSKSQIYFNFLPSRWDTLSVPTRPPAHSLQQVCLVFAICSTCM